MSGIDVEGQRAILTAALAARNDATDALSQFEFFRQYRQPPAWAVGPFELDGALTFTLEHQWEDPLGIGWTSESIFNPSVIARGDELHVFYRASPRKESLSSRIGHAAYTEHTGWRDEQSNPTVLPTLDNEVLGVEDPKVYAMDDGYVLFYNGIFPVSAEDRERYPSPGYPVHDVGCDINVATSPDLVTWTKHGPITDRAVTRSWAKGAVIPRDGAGRAVRIGGEYLMFLSEGCNGVQHVGRSTDLLNWRFDPQPYLDLTEFGGHIHEVATAIVTGDNLIIDFFYSDPTSKWAAGQALYSIDEPFRQRELNRGGTLAWGGLIQWGGAWLFAQGWDSKPGARELQVFTAPVVRG